MVQKWDQKDSFCRLLAATVAATKAKLNYHEIASLYGQGATYDSIEGQFRKIRKQAAELQEARLREETTPTAPRQATSFDMATASLAASPSTPAPKTPRKPRARTSAKKADTAIKAEETCGVGKVVGSRVAKKTGTPRKARVIKHESGDYAGGGDETEHAAAGGRKTLSYSDEIGPEHWDSDLPDIDGDFESGFYGFQI